MGLLTPKSVSSAAAPGARKYDINISLILFILFSVFSLLLSIPTARD